MYRIRFTKSSEKEWHKLDSAVRASLSKKLQQAAKPESSRNRLRGFGGELFKLKLTSPQIRLVYRLADKESQLIVLAVGGRDVIYEKLHRRQ